MSGTTAVKTATPQEEVALESHDIQKAAQALMITEGDRMTFKQIDGQAAADALSRLRQRIGVARKKVKEIFTPIKRKIDEAKAEALKQERGLDGPLERLDEAAANELRRYARALEDERQRKQREADAKAAEEKRKRDEETLAVAEIAEAGGGKELADEIIDSAARLGPATAVVGKPKIAGTDTRKVWKGEITDLKAFVKASLDTPFLWAAIESVKPDLERWAARQAPLLKSALNSYPGLKATEETDIKRSRI